MKIMESFNKRLSTAFRAMRKAGLLARQNFLCCGNCGGYAMATKAVELKKAGKTVNGCAFYHAQANESKNEGRDFYITYGELDTTEFGTIGLPTVEVGKIVASCLADAGVKHEWNGDPNQNIKVVITL
jgi:hypothetical protein